MSILDTVVGQELPAMVKPPIRQEQLNRYAAASGDSNPIHLNEEAAHRVGLDSIIAHGMLSMAFLGQYISRQITSDPQALLASLKVRYVGMVRLGDTLTCSGLVKNITVAGGQTTITIECRAQNQGGENVTVGEAEVVVPLTQTTGVNA